MSAFLAILYIYMYIVLLDTIYIYGIYIYTHVYVTHVDLPQVQQWFAQDV